MERCLLAGIPVWWRPSDHPGLRVSLMFRAGRIDETLLTAGRLSALMAWALLPTFPAYVSASGSFGGVVSHIDLYGPPDAVASVLGTIAARLHGPTDAEWAESEAAVLRMMADEDDFDTLLAERFGVCGPGAGSLRGPALQTLTAGWLREVGAGFFASGNAALALDGDVPAGLQLPLPAGGRLPAPPLPATREPIPRVYVTPDRLVLSGLLPTSDASVLAQRILRTRLEERLRYRLRSTYAVSCATLNFAESTLAVFSADVSAERFAEASGIVAETAWLLSAVPAGERELKDHAFATVQALRAPEVEAEEPFGAAHRELLGQAPRTVAERIAAVEGIGLADLRTPLASLFGSAMLGAPIDQPVDVDWPTDAVPREGRLEGRRHRPRRGAEHLFEPLCDIVVADGRLQLGSASSRFSVDAARSHVLAWPDGRRTVVDDDGRHLTIEPTLWRGGRRIVESVDRGADPRRTLPMPARAPDAIPAPLSFMRRARKQFDEGVRGNRPLQRRAALVVFLLLTVTLPQLLRTSPVAVAPAAGSPVAGQQWGNAYVSFTLPDDWEIDDFGINVFAHGPTDDERILVSSIDQTTLSDLDEMLRRRSECPGARKRPAVVISGQPAETIDCAGQGRQYRLFDWRMKQRLTEVTYSAATTPEQSEALRGFLASLVVHTDPPSPSRTNGPAAEGPRVEGPSFALSAPSGFTKVKNATPRRPRRPASRRRSPMIQSSGSSPAPTATASWPRTTPTLPGCTRSSTPGTAPTRLTLPTTSRIRPWRSTRRAGSATSSRTRTRTATPASSSSPAKARDSSPSGS